MEESILTEESMIPEGEQMTPPRAGRQKKKYILPACICGIAVLLIAGFFLTAKPRGYARAEKLWAEKDYAASARLFAQLGDYRDAAQRQREVRYAQALEHMEQERYTQALEILDDLGDYKAAVYQARQCRFVLGETAMEAGAYDEAAEYFSAAGTDAASQRRLDALYARGHQLFLEGEYEKAQEYFDRLEGRWPAGTGPHFVTFDEALDYIKAQAPELPETVTVVVEDMPGSYILSPAYLNTTLQQRLGYQFSTVAYNEETLTLTVNPSYYPGQKIVFAWKSGDVSRLTQEELEVYGIAQELVSQARAADPDPEAMELWLHDWLCANVEYDSPYEYVYPEDFVGLDELTCVGALRDGKANCQGYTDAFYLLGTLAGLEVYVIFGTADGGGHCWNGVRLDGKIYMVDVTFDDTLFQEPEYWSYIWYNNVLDLDIYTVSGGSHLFLGLVTRKDLSKTYYTRVEKVYEGINYAAYGLLREYRKNGAGVYHAVIEEADRTQEEFHQALINNMSLAGVSSARYSAALYTYEGDTYILVEWIRG